MVSLRYLFSACLVLVLGKSTSQAVELTFELADNAKECFFEEINKDTSFTIEFQVSWQSILPERTKNILRKGPFRTSRDVSALNHSDNRNCSRFIYYSGRDWWPI